MIEENYDDLFAEESAPRSNNGGGNYVPPAAQTELGKDYDTFFVKAFKKGERPFCEDFRDIDKACSRASFLHFREDYGTRVIAVNLEKGTAVELRWQGKETGYGIHTQPTN